MDFKLSFLVLVLMLVFMSNPASSAFVENVTSKISIIVCSFTGLFTDLATGIAAFVMILAGIRWVSSENDPGARKGAKEAMIHALVGLFFLTIIVELVKLSSGNANPMCI